MKIGDVSRRLGIPASTIRYYESEGLIDIQSRVSGKREFDSQAMLLLRCIQLAKGAGFSINEIKSLSPSYKETPNPSAMWATLARDKRRSIQEQIEDLQRMDKILGKLLDCDCDSLGDCVKIALTQR